MNPFRIVIALLVGTASVGAARLPAGVDDGATAPATRRPNILLIVSDDQAWTDYGFMGHPAIETPHLDALARESLRFPRGYVPSSLCCPSLASILTGKYPFQHGITGNEPTSDRTRRLEQLPAMIAKIEAVPTLPRRLAEAGYRSLQTGKWWLGDFRRGGFTHGMTHGDPERGGRHGDAGLTIGRQGLQPVADFLDEGDGEPFFVWYAPFLPHTPHRPPERLLEKYRTQTDSLPVAKYWAMCEWFDETCGALLGLLDDRGLTDNTLVAFVADNGWLQDPNSSRYAERSKRSPYDGGLRTPILLRWPGQISPATVDAPITSLDLYPTILKACGLDAPGSPGIDLRNRAALDQRSAIFGDCHLHDTVDLNDPAANLTYRWCIANGWKLIVPDAANVTQRAGRGARGSGKVELFHLTVDPHEQTDLAADHPERVAELRAKLDAWWPG